MPTPRDIAAAVADALNADAAVGTPNVDPDSVARFSTWIQYVDSDSVAADPFAGLDVPFTDMEGVR